MASDRFDGIPPGSVPPPVQQPGYQAQPGQQPHPGYQPQPGQQPPPVQQPGYQAQPPQQPGYQAQPPQQPGYQAGPGQQAAGMANDGLPMSVPLIALALGFPLVMFVGLLGAIARDIGTDLRFLAFFLGSAGAAAAATVGLVAGLVVLRRPASSMSSLGAVVLGGCAILFGLVTIVGSISFDFGLEEVFDRTVSGIIGPPGALLAMGAVALLVGLSAKNPGDAAPTIPILGLIGAAVLVGLNGIVREILGLNFSSDFLGRVASVLNAFSLESALLVLAAAVLLILHQGPSTLWPVVAGVAAGILVIIPLTSLVSLLSDDSFVAQVAQDPSRTSVALAVAAIALALAVLSASPERSAPR